MNKERYLRQTVLPDIGPEGQEKLHNARVLIIGAGGLGCSVSQYLTGAGIGSIGIADADVVSLSNLQRQILYTEDDLGKNKAVQAAARLSKMNSDIMIKAYPMRITEENAKEFFEEYDLIIDAVDNFKTRYLINDICVMMKKPFVHGAILRFQGQAMTYVPGNGPCYRCAFPGKPDESNREKVPGVIGAVAGMIGCVQAMETIKYFTGAGELLCGKLFEIDLLDMETMVIPISKREDCTCSKNQS